MPYRGFALYDRIRQRLALRGGAPVTSLALIGAGRPSAGGALRSSLDAGAWGVGPGRRRVHPVRVRARAARQTARRHWRWSARRACCTPSSGTSSSSTAAGTASAASKRCGRSRYRRCDRVAAAAASPICCCQPRRCRSAARSSADHRAGPHARGPLPAPPAARTPPAPGPQIATPVLLFGAGSRGQLLLRSMLRDPHGQYLPGRPDRRRPGQAAPADRRRPVLGDRRRHPAPRSPRPAPDGRSSRWPTPTPRLIREIRAITAGRRRRVQGGAVGQRAARRPGRRRRRPRREDQRPARPAPDRHRPGRHRRLPQRQAGAGHRRRRLDRLGAVPPAPPLRSRPS